METTKQIQLAQSSGGRCAFGAELTVGRRTVHSLRAFKCIPVLFFFMVALAIASSTPQDEQPVEREELPAARQNVLLRSHFREMYPRSASGGWNRRYEQPANDDFTERFIDRQIDNYLKELEKHLNRLEINMTVAEGLRARILTIRTDSTLRQQYEEAVEGFDEALEEVQKGADRLKDQLEYAFTGLQGKKRLEHEIDSTSQEDFYGEELRFLRRQIEEADERVRNYLFRSVNTVDVKELQEETMMVCLYQVEQMAREVRKSLK
jgi:hypothetical protein